MDEYTFSFPIWVEFGNGSSERVGEIAEKSLDTIEIHDNPRGADAEDLLEIARNSY